MRTSADATAMKVGATAVEADSAFESSAEDLTPPAPESGPLEQAWRASDEHPLHNPETWPAEQPALLSRNGVPVMLQGLPALLSGAGGLGKSTLLLDLCVTVAGGKSVGGERGQWCGFDVARGRAIYIGAEDGLRTIYGRVDSVVTAATSGAAESDAAKQARVKALRSALKLVSLSGAGAGACALVERDLLGSRRFVGSANAATLFRLAEEWAAEAEEGVALIVFDPGSRFLGSEAETDPGGATAGIEALAAFTKVKGSPAVLTAMHVTKSSKERGDASVNDVRGSAALVDGSRTVLGMTVLAPGYAKLSHVKANDCAQVAPVYLQRTDANVWKPVTAAAAERAAGEATAEERRREYVTSVAGWLASTRRALDRAERTNEGREQAAEWALEVMADWKRGKDKDTKDCLIPPWGSVEKFRALSDATGGEYEADKALLEELEKVSNRAAALVKMAERVKPSMAPSTGQRGEEVDTSAARALA